MFRRGIFGQRALGLTLAPQDLEIRFHSDANDRIRVVQVLREPELGSNRPFSQETGQSSYEEKARRRVERVVEERASIVSSNISGS